MTTDAADPDGDQPKPKRKREEWFLGLLLLAFRSGSWNAVDAAAPDLIDELGAAIAQRFGLDGLDTDAVRWTFAQNLRDYLGQHPELAGDDLRTYATLLVRAELQRAAVTLSKQAATLAGTERMRRITHPEASESGPCQTCLDLEGVHDAGDPDLYWFHPRCACTWEPAGADEELDFREGGMTALYFSDVPAEKRRELVGKGHALADGSYPIADKAHLKSAITLAQSGHGDVAAAKRLIRKRAKELDAMDMLPANFDEPDVSDVHVPGPVNASGGQRPTRHFLKRMMDKLKGKVSAAEFDEAVRHARAHAGGMTKAANRQAATVAGEWYDDTDNESPYLPASAVADQDGDNDADDGAQPKLEKADERINYRDATEVANTCGHCRFYHADEGACRVVEGFIRADGVCDLFSPVVVEMSAVQGSEADTDEQFFFSEPRFYMEPPARIPYLPKPGVYKHPQYGYVVITTERNQRFVQNFKNGVYQEELPIDAEHQTKLSGACGYVTDMAMNGDGSADAQVRWTDRGVALLKAGRFSRFSPEFYDEWTDPVTEQVHRDIAIGGALTTRSFFKSKSLRPLAASEHVLVGWFAPREEQQMAEAAHPFDGTHSHEHSAFGGADDNDDGMHSHTHDHSDDGNHDHTHTGAMMTEQTPTQNFAEELATRDAQIAALRAMTEQQAEQSKQYAEAIAGMERASRAKAFTDEVLGRGDASNARWYGEVEKHVAMMETLHAAGLQDELQQYIEQNRTHAEQLRTSGLFAEYGRAGTSAASTPAGKLDAMITAKVAEGLTLAEATDRVMSENPQLYAEYSSALSFREGE